jgi:hypothetical protein
MLTPETIGSYLDEKGSQHYRPRSTASIRIPATSSRSSGDTSARELVMRCVGSFRAHTKFPCEGGALPDVIEGIGWSDHWSFTRHGFPALMITDTAPFRYEHYHTAQDTPDKVDYERTARVVAGLERVVEELSSAN